MPRRVIVSECKSENCSATNPNVVDYPIDSFPTQVKEKILELNLENKLFRCCSYCGSIWVEEDGGLVRMVGIDTRASGDGMVWKIFE